jgi:tetraacyldisaccharide 4'-kinase
MREPPFWWRPAGLEAQLLAPAAALYGAVAARRLKRRGQRVSVPVVCIGNPTLGGAGKTPLALTVAGILAELREHPVFLSRGYGGRLAGPVKVDPDHHYAADVGDEPLMLARRAPAIVARDRVRGARAALSCGASVVVMDDGFQNPSLTKDISILVVDARRGIGNRKVFPAGPLRAPLADQLAQAHAMVAVGTSDAEFGLVREAMASRISIFHARLQPDDAAVARIAQRRVLAFAGIGDPGKFFATLADAGIEVAVTRAYPDHHYYTRSEALALCDQATREDLILVTTEKDLVRLRGDAGTTELGARAQALPVTLVLEQAAAFKAFLQDRLVAARAAVAALTPSAPKVDPG